MWYVIISIILTMVLQTLLNFYEIHKLRKREKKVVEFIRKFLDNKDNEVNKTRKKV